MTGPSRRGVLGGLAGATVAAGGAAAATALSALQAGDFAVPEGTVLLNSAGTHPLPRAALQAMTDYATAKSIGNFAPGFRLFATIEPARKLFAELINADPGEIALVQSTLAGENMVVSGLRLPGSQGNVVTDALHYDGSLYLYRSLERTGPQVRIAPTRDHAVTPEELGRLIDEHTRLVAVSLVSSVNGHVHDLAAICEIAHAKGALVYADIIQAAGAMPVDVKASKVDFAACGSYKWLMGDCGAGFLYVRKDLLSSAISRPAWGYMQCADLDQDAFAPAAPSGWPVRFTVKDDAAGFFEIGTPAFSTLVSLEASLTLIHAAGVSAISDHIRGLTEHLRAGLLKRGYGLVTPEGPAQMIAFRADAAQDLRKRLLSRKINVKADHDLIRISPAVFNTHADIERLLSALPA